MKTTMDRRDTMACCFALAALLYACAGCDAEGLGDSPADTTPSLGAPQRGAAGGAAVVAPDAGAPDLLPAATSPDTTAVAWKSSLTFGTGYLGDGGIGGCSYTCVIDGSVACLTCTNYGQGDVLTGVSTSYTLPAGSCTLPAAYCASAGMQLYFRFESAADIAGRGVVVYTGDLTAVPVNVVGSYPGPASGHVVIGTASAPGGTTLIHACLTTADMLNPNGWTPTPANCTDVAVAQITVTP